MWSFALRRARIADLVAVRAQALDGDVLAAVHEDGEAGERVRVGA